MYLWYTIATEAKAGICTVLRCASGNKAYAGFRWV